MEEAVERHYRHHVQLERDTVEMVRQNLLADLQAMETCGQTEVERQRQVIADIEKRRRQVAAKTEDDVIRG